MKNRLREFRKERRLTQEEFGRLVGVSRETISSLERGKYNPSLPLAFKIARVLNVSIEEIFSLEDDE
ncbi:MAG: helix-turn-helix transcriptional regulator [Promethearchaeota archaeon]